MFTQSVMLGTSPMPPTSKNKSGLVKGIVYFNGLLARFFLTKCPFRLVVDYVYLVYKYISQQPVIFT